MKRRIVSFNHPVNATQFGKAGNKDPRNFISGGGVETQDWDIDQFSRERQQLDQFPPDQYSRVARTANQKDGIVQSVPTRISYIRWTLDGLHPPTLALVPYLLVPKNPNRLDLQLSSTTYNLPAPLAIDILYYSWGKPPLVGPAGNVPLGNVLAPGTSLPRIGGICPIDDLWVWNLTVANVIYCAFEGIEAIEANQ